MTGRDAIFFPECFTEMEFIAKSEVKGSFMQFDIRLREQKLAYHFQFDIHLVCVKSFPVCFFEMIVQGSFTDEKAVSQFFPCKKGLRCCSDQSNGFGHDVIGRRGAHRFVLLFRKLVQEQI